jgi:predicted nucleic acid-binding Zn ribbon protein
MERAGRLIGRLNGARQVMTNEELARAAWPLAVGKKIASHTAAAALVRTCLVVEVQDIVWQKQLYTLRGQILKNLVDIVGKDVITDLELRPMTPKRQPQRSESARPQPALSLDEADAIADPVLRRNYRVSRRKASA